MAVSCTYHKIGQGVSLDGTEIFNFYGEDFNPNVPSIPDGWTTAGVSVETSTFDLSASGWQPGHEVGCMVAIFNISDYAGTVYTVNRLQVYRSGGWTTTWTYTKDFSSNYTLYMYYMYFGIDSDEIRSYSNSYRIRTDWGTDNGMGSGTEYSYFDISGLSIDSSSHPSGALWVEGRHLCYTDAINGSSGYKHKIAYDGSWSEYVGSDNAGYIRLDSSDSQRIYYVDSSGMKRRTYPSSQWYGGNVNVGSSYRGFIWASDGDLEDGYGHLCFIAPNGNKRRILNGPPSGHT